MKIAKNFTVAIEETVVQEFEISADSAENAMKIAEEQYKKGIIVLAPGEVQFRQMAVVKPNEKSAVWCEF